MTSVDRSSLDMISDLPSHILESILMFLPTHDAVRTSILSRKWRYRWAKLPQLVFDETVPFESLEDPRDILLNIYETLLLHHGPISKFTLDINNIGSCPQIDRMINFLSRNGIEQLKLCVWGEGYHKLPSCIFSCLQLRHLSLHYCVFKPPPTFEGFSKLISLELWEVDLGPVVSITAFPLLERLTLGSIPTVDYFSVVAPNLNFLYFKGSIRDVSFVKTPLLAELSLTADEEYYVGESTFDLMEVFGCLSLIENLHLYYRFLKLLAVYNVPMKLPIVLNNLRNLELSAISFTDMDELSSTMCLIRSCPNLQKLKFEVTYGYNRKVEPALEYLGMLDYSDVSLNKLRELEIHRFTGLSPELEVIKFLLDISPELETVHIKPASSIFDKSGYKMFTKLTRFRRASPKAEIIFPDLDEDKA